VSRKIRPSYATRQTVSRFLTNLLAFAVCIGLTVLTAFTLGPCLAFAAFVGSMFLAERAGLLR